MKHRLIIFFAVAVAVAVAALALSSAAFAQDEPENAAPKNRAAALPAAPAPVHDISGLWEPVPPRSALNGPRTFPNDGKPEHQIFTPYGLEVYNSHKPLLGPHEVGAGFGNDPRSTCEPLGFPRVDWHYLMDTQIVQTNAKVLILYEYDQRWREIVMNEELPKDLLDSERRYYGYSVAQWADDTTLVVETTGLIGGDRMWLDSSGRPISEEAKIEERFHRTDHDTLLLTVTVDDPKMYTKPWVANKDLPFKLQPANKRVLEILCSPREESDYLKQIGDTASGAEAK